MSYADRQWAVGDTIVVDVTVNNPTTGLGLDGQTPSLWLRRESDGLYWTGAAWGAVTALAPSEVDATNLPGLYRYTGPAATEDRYTARAKIDNAPTVQGEAYEVHVGVAKLAREGADGDTLETLSDQLDTVGGGDGVLQLVVHLRDALSAAIPAGKIAVYDSANAVLVTEATADNDGNATIPMTALGTYKLRCARAGYGFTSPTTVVFATDGQVATITGAALTLTPASDPQYCRVQTSAPIRDAGGKLLVGYVVRFIAQVPQVAQGGVMHSRTFEGVTDASGHLTSTNHAGEAIVGVDLPRGAEVARLAREIGYSGTTYSTVPDSPTQDFATWV